MRAQRASPFLQPSDGVLQSLVLLLQLLVAVVKHLKSLGVSLWGSQMWCVNKTNGRLETWTRVKVSYQIPTRKRHTYRQRSFFNLLTFASSSAKRKGGKKRQMKGYQEHLYVGGVDFIPSTALRWHSLSCFQKASNCSAGLEGPPLEPLEPGVLMFLPGLLQVDKHRSSSSIVW